MEVLYMDIYGPLQTTDSGHSSILSIKDGFTRYTFFIATKNITSETIILGLSW